MSVEDGPAVSNAPATDSLASNDPSLVRARRLLYGALVTFTGGLLAGTAWDVYFHSRNTFDSFWTPPHLVLYLGVVSAGAFAFVAARNPELRRWFGPPYRFPLVSAPIPGCLALTAGGVLVMLLGGALDDLWHSTYGLDETRWSLPHAMIAWGAFLVVLGLFGCRLALSAHRPISSRGRLLWAVIVLGFSLAVFLGPFFLSTTPDSMGRISRLPGFQGAETQHYFRVVAASDLYRTNLGFPALVGLWAGVGLAIVKGLDDRARFLFIVTAGTAAVATTLGLLTAIYVGTLESIATWLAPPVFIAPAAWILLRRWTSSNLAFLALSGAALGLCTSLIYGFEPVRAVTSLAASATMVVGTFAGQRLLRVAEKPTPSSAARAIPIVGVAVPTALGVLDMLLRAGTP